MDGKGKWEPYEGIHSVRNVVFSYCSSVESTVFTRRAAWSKGWFNFRWTLLSPLRKQVTPHIELSVGELIVFVVMIAGCVFAVFTQGTVDSSGSIAAGFGCLTFLTVSHNSLFTLLLGLPFERALRYHIFFAYLTVLAGFWHGYLAVVLNAESENGGPTAPMGWAWNDSEWLSGFFFELFMAVMVLLSQSPIRRHFFEFFYKMHWLLLMATGVSGLLHNAGLMG